MPHAAVLFSLLLAVPAVAEGLEDTFGLQTNIGSFIDIIHRHHAVVAPDLFSLARPSFGLRLPCPLAMYRPLAVLLSSRIRWTLQNSM